MQTNETNETLEKISRGTEPYFNTINQGVHPLNQDY